MRFNKIVFVRYFPLTKAIYTDLYFEELIKNDFQVEYLDVTALFNFKMPSSGSFNFSGNVKIKDYKQLDTYLKSNCSENVLFISIMTFEGSVYKLYRHFTKYNLKLGVFARGVFPDYTPDLKFKLKKIVKALEYKRIYNYCLNKFAILSKKYGFIKTYDIIFKAGNFGYWGLGIGGNIDFSKAEIIDVNTVDYDQYIISKEKNEPLEKEDIVFLDQYLPYHPDAINFDIKTVEPVRYFKELNAFFDKLELITGKKIIIAAHPKAESYKTFNPYNNRKIYFNQTNELVRNSALVLTHASTAVCFPVCYKKKIILVTSNYINEILPHFSLIAKGIEIACDVKIINIDATEPVTISLVINEEKYHNFKYNYLTSNNSEHLLSKIIFINFLNKGRI
jgi:hypothetical protein